MKTTIGGDRLGSGAKESVSMRNYSRSTHDLGYLWRSSMSSGTLVPFMAEVGLPGDTFDINLQCEVLTLPTIGPLFGSYKVQLDVFMCPVRLYNGSLHMNKLGIGMNMAEIKLPLLELTANSPAGADGWQDNEQVNASSIFSFLNIRGVGRGPQGLLKRRFNALSYLSYWDIYKQYYANKQEEEGVMIHVEPALGEPYDIFNMTLIKDSVRNDITSAVLNATVLTGSQVEVTLYNGVGNPDWDSVTIREVSGADADYVLSEAYSTKQVDGLTCTWSNFTAGGGIPITGDWQNSIGQQIQGSTDPTQDSRPQLSRFPLENIDTMRELILKDTGSATNFVIDRDTIAPYGLPLKYNDVLDPPVFSSTYTQEGLAIKTYQSDLFNNWISTDWIDGPNGVNEITSVDTTGDSFTIDSLNLAQKVYNMLNRIAISGGTYDDWLDAVYTHERSRSVENPVYQGSLIKELTFQEVISSADTDGTMAGDQPLGTLAGRGKLTQKNKGGRIKVRCDEPCYVMGIVSITPRIDYSQGNKWDTNLRTMDDFHKPALDAIGYQDLVTDQMAWFDTQVSSDPEFTPVWKSAGKQPAWINYMTNVNVVRGNFAERNDSMFMVLNRRYENDALGITDLTTYVDPTKFNHIFADTRLDAQNFWVQIKNDIKARRKMSAKVIPNL